MPQPNRYTSLVERYWREYFPDQVARMNDPETFFGARSAEIAERVEELTSPTTPGPTGQDYLGTVGRLGQERSRAEEVAIAELLPIPDDDPETEEERGTAGWVSLLEDHPQTWLRQNLDTEDPDPT